MGFLDIILFIVYVALFYIFFRWRRKRIQNPLLQRYHYWAFWAKIFATFAITIFNFYISPGDSTILFYTEGVNIYKLILKDAMHFKWLWLPGQDFDLTYVYNYGNVGYFPNPANYFIIKTVAIFSFFGFGRYSVIQLFFSMIAFSGIWKLFYFFYELYPTLHKRLAVAILFFPTVLFWSSGILKDPICMGMLGWLTWSIYQGIHKKKNPVRNLIIAGISGYILGIVKPYILFAYLPFYILFIILTNIHLIKNTVLKGVAFVFIIAFSIGGFLLISDRLEEEMGFFAIEKLAESVKAQQRGFINMSDIAESSFSLGVEYDGSAGSLVRIAPAAINATLFRPYIWESKKVSTLLSSLESLMLMFFTLYVFYRAGPIRFFRLIIQKPMILFCFTYSIMFSLFIGATTLNFGTLVRYKIPAIPFYLIALILILHFSTSKKIRPAGKGGPSVVSE